MVAYSPEKLSKMFPEISDKSWKCGQRETPFTCLVKLFNHKILLGISQFEIRLLIGISLAFRVFLPNNLKIEKRRKQDVIPMSNLLFAASRKSRTTVCDIRRTGCKTPDTYF